MDLFTIGHSTRTREELARLLKAHGVRRLVDVRSYPRSFRNPQFNKDTLGPFLRRKGISYRHLPELGGRRRPKAGSALNAAWRSEGFRGYADYMQTPAFEAGLRGLLDLAAGRATAVMCAEAVPWRCHRSLLSDALVARGVPVRHITGPGRARGHVLNPMARRRRGRLAYPAAPEEPAPPRRPLSCPPRGASGPVRPRAPRKGAPRPVEPGGGLALRREA